MATVLVLGVGIQGRAAIRDMEERSSVAAIIAADADADGARAYVQSIEATRTRVVGVDARDTSALREVLLGGAPRQSSGQARSAPTDRVDLVINMLPAPFEEPVLEAAIDVGVHLVSTNYGHRLRAFDADAARRGIVVMPEAGFDPGIDLVIAGEAKREFDEIDTLLSYGAGIPAPECRDTNRINYKISWSFEGLLRSYARPARVVMDGQPRVVEAADIFEPAWTHTVTFDGLGDFEAFVNGDAVEFLELLGIDGSVRTSARYSLRWPGHCAFWRRVADLGLLDDTPPAGGGPSPRAFLQRHLEPRLRYGAGERDMIMLRIDARGTRDGRPHAVRWEMVDCGEPGGMLAMSRAVGFTASIVAQMILDGDITRAGVGCPARDVPAPALFDALRERGMTIRRTTQS